MRQNGSKNSLYTQSISKDPTVNKRKSWNYYGNITEDWKLLREMLSRRTEQERTERERKFSK